MITPHTEDSLSETLDSLVQIQNELRKLLRSCAVTEHSQLRHSLFCSRRVFRSDELHVGLRAANSSPFSTN